MGFRLGGGTRTLRLLEALARFVVAHGVAQFKGGAVASKSSVQLGYLGSRSFALTVAILNAGFFETLIMRLIAPKFLGAEFDHAGSASEWLMSMGLSFLLVSAVTAVFVVIPYIAMFAWLERKLAQGWQPFAMVGAGIGWVGGLLVGTVMQAGTVPNDISTVSIWFALIGAVSGYIYFTFVARRRV
jgi:hypothetical protein